MGMINPRLLALLLEDLMQDLEWWALRSSDLLAAATYSTHAQSESLLQSERVTLLAAERAREETQLADSTCASIEDAHGRSLDCQTVSTATLHDARVQVAQAEQALQHWQAQLSLAQQWQVRAENRVARAEADLKQAISALHAAEAELRAAEAELAACRAYRDEKGNGRNCAGPAARVRAAQLAVANAEAWVARAQQELADARAELTRAVARVAACTKAVAISQNAVATAADSLQRATDALTSIERALEATSAAMAATTSCKQLTAMQETAAEEAFAALAIARTYHEESILHLRTAEQSEEAGQRLRILAGHELTARIDALGRVDSTAIHMLG